MPPTLLVSIISPMLTFSAGLAVIFHYLSGKKQENAYEQELKHLRRSLLQGKLDRKSFIYIKDSLKAEDRFSVESKRLDELFEQQRLDDITYIRMKKALELTFNDKLLKIHERHTN